MKKKTNYNEKSTLSRVLVEPIITEAATRLVEQNKYIFKVSPQATKVQIRKAIELVYPDVKVKKINTVSVPAKRRVRGRIVGRKPGYRKAIVTLEAESKIDVFDGK